MALVPNILTFNSVSGDTSGQEIFVFILCLQHSLPSLSLGGSLVNFILNTISMLLSITLSHKNLSDKFNTPSKYIVNS